MLEANISQNVYLGTTRVLCFDLLTVGDGASLAREAALLGYRIERDRLIIGPATVGHEAYVGLRAIMGSHTSLGDGAELDDLSVLPAGRQVPAQEGPALRERAALWGRGVAALAVPTFGPLCAAVDGRAGRHQAPRGRPRVQHGPVSVLPTVVGPRTLVGNGAVLAGGTMLGANNLIGALLRAPITPPDGTSWVGSPDFLLPNRPVSTAFAPERTFNPPASLVWARRLIEIVKIVLPIAFTFITFAVLYHYGHWHLLHFPFWSNVVAGTGALAGLIFAFSSLIALLKWVLIGRYRPSETPLWSSFAWRNELVNLLYKSHMHPFWEVALLGAPFATWFFQLMGSRFGHSVYMDTPEITEFDLTWVADHAVLNNGSTIQTHLFEDRVMKMSNLRIGRHATVGTSCVVLYDSVIGPGATLTSLSLLMKGEQLPANTHWQGIPSSFVSNGQVN